MKRRLGLGAGRLVLETQLYHLLAPLTLPKFSEPDISNGFLSQRSQVNRS